MSDPSLELQGALVALFSTANGGAGVGVADRVFDSVPEGAAFPYIRVGDAHVLGDDDECEQISEVVERIHVWSRATGWPEAKAIVAKIRDALRASTITLADFNVDSVQFVQTLFLEDPDGISRHAVLEVRFLISHG